MDTHWNAFGIKRIRRGEIRLPPIPAKPTRIGNITGSLPTCVMSSSLSACSHPVLSVPDLRVVLVPRRPVTIIPSLSYWSLSICHVTLFHWLSTLTRIWTIFSITSSDLGLEEKNTLITKKCSLCSLFSIITLIPAVLKLAKRSSVAIINSPVTYASGGATQRIFCTVEAISFCIVELTWLNSLGLA